MDSRLALITFLDGGSIGLRPDHSLPGGPPAPVDPGYGRPGGGWSPVDPGYGQGHLRPHRPDNTLPGRPPYPTTGPVLPPPPDPPTIDNTLPPTAPPPTIALPIVLPPGETVPATRRFELKYSVHYGWVLVPVADETAQPKG